MTSETASPELLLLTFVAGTQDAEELGLMQGGVALGLPTLLMSTRSAYPPCYVYALGLPTLLLSTRSACHLAIVHMFHQAEPPPPRTHVGDDRAPSSQGTRMVSIRS